MDSVTSADERPLRPGDVVEVRSAAEILATLDGDAALDRMPFMPEMVPHTRRRYRVTRRVDKICDTIAATGSRRMHATVYLEDLRCDGSGHGGAANLGHLAQEGTRTVREVRGDRSEVWRCQATEAFNASETLKTSQLGQYWRELTNGNFGLLRFTGLAARGFFMEIADRVGLLKPLPLRGPGSQSTPSEPLDLQPGDVVQVRRPSEIAATLDKHGLNRGLNFDREMLPYCGRTFRVKDRVTHIIDDKTGRMLNISKDCLILDGAVCSGERSAGRWFCPRQIHAYWREAWLRRVEQSDRT
jgi:hypothetical protein